MKLKVCLLAFLTALTLCPFCAGAESTEYLFRLRPEASAAGLDAEPICAAEGVYVTEDYDLVRALDSRGDLVYYEENSPVYLMDYSRDAETLAQEEWQQAILGADYAVERGNGGEGVVIGMIDSGITADHPDFSEALILQGTNYCAPREEDEAGGGTEDGEAYSPRRDTTDEEGHGTFAASLLVSGRTGLCPKAALVPLKCFGSSKNGSIDDIVEAIYDAVDVYGCDVINMSLGVGENSQTFQDAVTYADEHGVILVAAAGNVSRVKDSGEDDPLLYPAAYEQVISVGSLDSGKKIANYSSRNSSVLIAAPGHNVRGISILNDGYVTNSGTSFSAPTVSAAAALARSAVPSLTPSAFAGLLSKTAEDLGAPGYDHAYGYGMMNLGLLLAAVTKDTGTMIPSYFNETLCLSLWRPIAEKTMTLLARYETDGRFRSLEELSGRGMNNLPVSPDAPELLLMSLDRDTLVPLAPAVNYRGEESPEQG